MGDLSAVAGIRGLEIELALAWSDPGPQARSLRVLRRRWGYPTSPGDGLVVLDLADLMGASGTPAGSAWARIERTRFLLLNTRAEAGVLQAEIAEYYAAAADAQPAQVSVAVYDPKADAMVTTVIRSVTRVTSAAGTSPQFGAITTLVIYARPGPGPEAPAGTVVISTQSQDPALMTTVTDFTQPAPGTDLPPRITPTKTLSPSRIDWTPAGTGPKTASALFVRQEVAATTSSVSGPGASFQATFVTTMGSQTLRTVTFTEAQNGDSGNVDRTLAVVDRDPPRRVAEGLDPGLDPRVTYYYAAFEDRGLGFPATPDFTASAIATGRHGFSEKLFAQLPAVHRFYDDPASGPQPGTSRPGSWQLRRFLQVMGPALDQARSLGETLRTLHDVFEVRADYLPYLASWIGWDLDRTLPAQRQRTDVLVAPEIYATLGTVPNIEALVNRSSGWACKAKEFVNNVFLTNAVEDIRLWEIWQTPPAFPAPLPVTPAAVTHAVNDSIDGRPTVVAEPTAGEPPWLFWHSRRSDVTKTPASTRRQLWMKTLDGPDAPRPVMAHAPDDAPVLTFSDESPAAMVNGSTVQLFWSSNREGAYGIWTRTLVDGAPGAAAQLTSHPAGDHSPAVVNASGTAWLFWHSSRRGPTDIWAMKLAAGVWSSPQRITSGQPRDRMPAACVDTATPPLLHLFWSADLGDRSRIHHTSFDGTSWSTPDDVSSPPVPGGFDTSTTFRDEAPTVVSQGGTLWLFWSSNRDGIFRLWGSSRTGAGWSAPAPVTTGRSAEKEPAAFVDGASAPRLLFRTQRGGEIYRSRTAILDGSVPITRGEVGDRWHYTYSTTRSDPPDPSSYYSRDAVGLYITPDDVTNREPYHAEADRLATLVEPFRPLPARFLWFVEPSNVTEDVYGKVDIGESYVDDAPDVDTLGAIGESSTVTTGWVVLLTNTPGDVTADPLRAITMRNRTFFPAPT